MGLEPPSATQVCLWSPVRGSSVSGTHSALLKFVWHLQCATHVSLLPPVRDSNLSDQSRYWSGRSDQSWLDNKLYITTLSRNFRELKFYFFLNHLFSYSQKKCRIKRSSVKNRALKLNYRLIMMNFIQIMPKLHCRLSANYNENNHNYIFN